jgi:secondary thiamine-phosphate synthase enzyme
MASSMLGYARWMSPTQWLHEPLSVDTPGKGFINITDRVAAIVARSGLHIGQCLVFVRHTSASLLIQENADPAVLRDLERWMSELVPEHRAWEHDDEGPDDMPAHARTALTRTSELVPIIDGRLALGTWQGLYLWEHRNGRHRREIVVQLSGTGQR